jgi:chromosome segregation ATPase
MIGAISQYIPISLWILAGAMTILILLVAFGFYFFWQRWAGTVAEIGSDVASLSARKQILEKDVESLREWIAVHKDELDLVKAEREKQERERALLADLEQQCAIRNQENQALRNEVGELENQRHHLTQTLEALKRDIGDLEAKRAEKEALESRLAQLKPQVEETQKTIQNLAAMKAMLDTLTSKKEALDKEIEDLRSTGVTAKAEADRSRNDAVQARIDLEQLTRELLDSRQQKAELDVTISQLQHAQHTLKSDIQHLDQKIEDLNASAEDLLSNAAAAKAEADRSRNDAVQARIDLEQLTRELLDSRQQKAELDVTISQLQHAQRTLKSDIQHLDQKIEDLKVLAQQATEEFQRSTQEAQIARTEAEEMNRRLGVLVKDRQHVMIELDEINAKNFC